MTLHFHKHNQEYNCTREEVISHYADIINRHITQYLITVEFRVKNERRDERSIDHRRFRVGRSAIARGR